MLGKLGRFYRESLHGGSMRLFGETRAGDLRSGGAPPTCAYVPGELLREGFKMIENRRKAEWEALAENT